MKMKKARSIRAKHQREPDFSFSPLYIPVRMSLNSLRKKKISIEKEYPKRKQNKLLSFLK